MTQYQFAEDSEILSGMARGQEAALEVLYDRFHRQCYAFALRILGSEEDADEAVQETFVRAWRRASSYDVSRATAATWLFSITRNLCLDELRRRRRRVPADLGNPEQMEQQRAETLTDREAEQAILSEQVRAAMQSLPTEQRSAIELVYFHGLSSQEVGQMLDVPPPTIRSRLRLGLLKLGDIMEETGVIER